MPVARNSDNPTLDVSLESVTGLYTNEILDIARSESSIYIPNTAEYNDDWTRELANSHGKNPSVFPNDINGRKSIILLFLVSAVDG